MTPSSQIPAPKGGFGRVRFGVFEADLASGELRKGGIKIKLQDQPFRVLALLLEKPGQLTPREEIQKRIWGGTEVDFEHGLGRAINKIRDALGDSADNPRFIETLTRRGYRFIAPVERDRALPPSFDMGSSPSASVVEVPARVPAPPTSRRIGWALVLIGIAIAGFLLLGRLAREQDSPRLVRSTQVTDSGRVYPGELTFESFPTVLTDGTRLYFQDLHDGRTRPVSVTATESNPHPVVLPSEIFAPSLADISPSGSQLLIRNRAPEIEQPIWVIPALGGGGRRVGSVMAHDATWAPDGQSIVYAVGSDIFIVNADGSDSRKLGSLPGRAFWLRWSPDGQRLRFTLIDVRSHSMRLWEMSADGHRAGPLFPGWSSPAECCGNWTPDGRYFAFQATRDGMTDIWINREETSIFRRTASPSRLTAGPLSYMAPVPSRDGRRLYVVGAQMRSEILALDARRHEFISYLPEIGAVSSLELSKDRVWAAWVTSSNLTLWRSRMDGSQRLQLTSPPMQVYMMRWSPDGRQIVFMGRSPGRVWKLYTIPAQGGTAKELLHEDRNEADPTWSADGERIAFGRLPEYMAEPASPKAIHILDLRSGKLETLPDSAGLFSPRWSPDGTRLAAMPLNQGSLAIYEFATRRWANVARYSVDNPVWSADSAHVYFRSFMEQGHPTRRIRISDASIETVATLQDFRRADIIDYIFLGLGLGLGHNETPLVQVRLSTADVYSLEWRAP